MARPPDREPKPVGAFLWIAVGIFAAFLLGNFSASPTEVVTRKVPVEKPVYHTLYKTQYKPYPTECTDTLALLKKANDNYDAQLDAESGALKATLFDAGKAVESRDLTSINDVTQQVSKLHEQLGSASIDRADTLAAVDRSLEVCQNKLTNN